MSTFSPPTEDLVVPVIVGEYMNGQYLPNEQRAANRLGTHIVASPRGKNVYLLTDSSYVQKQPSDMTTVTKTYYGGHNNEVTAEEVTALTAAGYGSYIT